MDELAKEYKLSLYEVLTTLKNNEKTKVELVQHTTNRKIYIRKTLSHYNINVYKKIEELNNPHIPKIYDVIETNNKLVIIEEFINGNTLQEMIDKGKTLKETKVIAYMIDLCDFLNAIHSLNPPIIHRDIKPANIIINNDNILKVIDYDASRFYKFKENTDTIILGTQGYAPPEQFGFTQTDSRSDIYSMGVLMNVLTVGKHPIDEKNNGFLKDIIEKCTKILADHRYQSALELKEELLELYAKIYKISRERTKIETNIKSNDSKKIDFKRRNILDIIPGFRTRTLWKGISSVLVYAFLICSLFLYEGEITQNSIIINATFTMLLLFIWLLCTNFLNVRDKLPIFKNKTLITDVTGYVVYIFILFLITGLIQDFLKSL